MKNRFISMLLALCLAIGATMIPTNDAQAQIRNTVTLSQATVSGADTSLATFSVDATHKSYTAKVVKSSGTLAGKVYFLGTVDETNYDKLDSMTIANVSTDQVKTFTFANTQLPYFKYRVSFETSTGAAAVTLYRVRRNQ